MSSVMFSIIKIKLTKIIVTQERKQDKSELCCEEENEYNNQLLQSKYMLIIQYLIIVNLFVLVRLIKQFVYGTLTTTDKFNHSMGIQVMCIVKFSPHHYNNRQLKLFNGHTNGVCSIEFSSFNDGRYLCSGPGDTTICLCDVEPSRSLHVFNGHEKASRFVDISPLQSNNNKNDNKNNSVGVIGGHEDFLRSVKYGSNELLNTILSGSDHCMFNGYSNSVNTVEYAPFVIKNNDGNSNVMCSGSNDNTIHFWDIRSNKDELCIIKGDKKEDNRITCFKCASLKKKGNNNEQKLMMIVVFIYVMVQQVVQFVFVE
ncbi:WD repeat-containing protein [Reticulomyxa filosa]|uniref:WD repeat-containing protein n=1 Tax=Reticulomyxa filosa TaxID=46433 RepID=X6P9R8_RETFI|nr:WD repeat-containing protein [Reticulomyxa filosa]|eukprot:ETO34362.1 WD repeat-containing protein [Reticulomyxa filosa]